MFNVVAEKLSLNKTYFLNNMPKDTIFIFLLQHPVYAAEKLQQLYAKLFNSFKNKRQAEDSKIFDSLYNSVSRHLGYNTTISIEKFITNVMKQFHFMLLSENLYKSLVSLRRLLCWELHDMIHIPEKQINISSYNEQHNVNIENYVNLNQVDFKLYETVESQLMKHIEEQDFMDEYETLKDLNTNIIKLCNEN